MIKTYSMALLGVLLVGMQTVQAQESMDDVFAQLDIANEAGGQPTRVPTTIPAATQSAQANSSPEQTAGLPQASANGERDALTTLFQTGLELYKAGKYDEAIMAFDTMLVIDKYDSRAVAYRKRASQHIGSKEIKKQEASRAQAFADVHAAWSRDPRSLVAVEEGADPAAMAADRMAIEQMEARMKAIIIPKLEFSDAHIEEVVLFLVDTTRRLGSAGGKDVDILLFGIDDGGSGASITISVDDMNLYEALEFIVEMAALKFEVKPNLVAIMPASYVPVSKLILKSYDIIPEVGTDMESSGSSGGGAGDLFGDSSSSAGGTGPVDAAGFFSMVGFPEGASAIYQPRFHKLFVKNTSKNIKAIDSVLADLDEEAIKLRSQQVEIETKFVEFNEGSLEELGFDWSVFGSGTAASLGLDPRGVTAGLPANTATIDPNTGQIIGVDQNDRPGQNLFGGSQRDNTGAFASVATGVLASMGGSPAAMLFSNGDIDFQITAMEQEGSADVLSAPKVTTKSGSEAIIRVAETHRYPQDYDVETGQRTAPVVKPQDWEDFDLGVSLKVTPVVDTDSNTIELDLQPEIIKFRGFDEYLVGYNAFDGGNNDTAAPGGTGEALISLMPFFERRTVQTQVIVADGSTVMMGGMIDERTETFRDQVPFLGDIPYLGRLFRTEGSRTAKKNLTIFVTATMVDAHGMTRSERELARQ